MKFLIFILGTIIGSFLNVCIYRIPKGESIVYPSSHCINCGQKIKWRDLIPIISFIVLKGKCRNCKEKISLRYPLIEILTGILYVFVYIKYGITLEFFKYTAFISILLVAGIIDFYTGQVYFNITGIGITVAVLFLVLQYCAGCSVANYIYAAIGSVTIIFIIIFVTGSMGYGDAEIFFLSGLFLGIKLTICLIVCSFLFGSLGGIILIIFQKKSKKDYIPFIPFITLSLVFTILLGNRIIECYLDLF